MKVQWGKSHVHFKRDHPMNADFSNTTKLVLGSIFAGIAALLQSAGIIVGIGYAFSIFATLPIVLSSLISLRIGVMSYFLTIGLLVVIQPSELLVFPFTTGLLGLTMGGAFRLLKSWRAAMLFSGTALTAGILFLLYAAGFPVLGPSVPHEFDGKISLIILLFSIFYSWIWTGISKRAALLLKKAAGQKTDANG